MAFVPAWYLLMLAIVGHKPLTFRLVATGQILTVDGAHLTLISAGLSSVTMIVGFAVFAAIRRTLAFDKRLVFAGYRQATLIAAKTCAIAVIAAGVALYTAAVLLAFWRPGTGGWPVIWAGLTAMALTYAALGLLGVLVKGDLEGFFLIVMGGLMDTFLQTRSATRWPTTRSWNGSPPSGPCSSPSAARSPAKHCGGTSRSAWPGPPPSPPVGWSSSSAAPAPAGTDHHAGDRPTCRRRSQRQRQPVRHLGIFRSIAQDRPGPGYPGQALARGRATGPAAVVLTGLPSRAPHRAPGFHPRPPRTPGTPR